jgi:hypothetical protein
MKRPFWVIIGFAAVISVSLAFTKHKDSGYKNLQILPKDITKQQMDSVMHHFNESLNVKCSFCHVRNDSTNKMDFASDDKPHKNKAREMMKLTNKINDDYFDVTGGQRTITTQLMVTCYTCHHGSTEPAVKAAKKEEMPSPFRQLNDTTRRSQ